MGFVKNVIDLLFPPRCVFCGRFLKKGETEICKNCAKDLPFTEGAETFTRGEFFGVCAAPLYYRDNVRKSILKFKFGGAISHADCYARLMADCVNDELKGKYNLITWVPISDERMKKRGYDQAMLLALATALRLDDVAVETLRKTADIPAQSSIEGAEKRRANVMDAYEAVDTELVSGRKILLVDDIVTTGATLSECARTLLMAGAESVVCIALARK